MNIFEQYGIKEVADCTLYAIALDKYDDEIYIPIMYFDTLKVSTIEQTSSQVSARGGLGNPELITWDFGKEISVNLEDALYSPASQSLMWGGQFGIGKQKIYGAWDPYIYDKDRYGKTIYLNKVVISQSEWEELTEEEQKNYCKFVCPCDEQIKYMTYTPAGGKYKYASVGANSSNRDSEGRFIGETYKFDNKTIYENDETKTIYTCHYMMSQAARPEQAQIIMDNFGDFDYAALRYIPYNESEDEVEPSYTDLCPYAPGIRAIDYEKSCIDELEYKWIDSNIKMTSLEGDQDNYYLENVGIRYRAPVGQSEKSVMAARQHIWKYEDGEKTEEITSYTNFDLVNQNNYYSTEYDEFDSKIDFYLNIEWDIPNEGKTIKHFTKVKVGTFYIIDDLNESNSSINDMIYPIESGINDVYYLDRMEKCQATQTFAINTDKNTRMFMYSELPQYKQTELTVFINPKTMKPYDPNSNCFKRRNGNIIKGNLCIIKQYDTYYKWTRSKAPEHMSLGKQIIIDAVHFPGTYRLVGETYSRSREDGKDQRLQFEIPLCKMSSNMNLALSASGEPTTFTMNLKVLRREDGVMMKLTQYNVEKTMYGEYCSDSTEIVPTEALCADYKCKEESGKETIITYSYNIISPDEQVYCLPGDCQAPYSDLQYPSLDTVPAPYVELVNNASTNVPRDKVMIERTTYEDGVAIETVYLSPSSLSASIVIDYNI